MGVIVSLFLWYLDFGICSLGNFRCIERECFKLLEEISKVLEDKRNIRK